MDTLTICAAFTSAGSKPWTCSEQSWRQPAEPWLLAHDLYHHRPTDTGTVQQELETLGAEYYIAFESDPGPYDHVRVAPSGWNALSENCEGVIGQAWDATEPGGACAPEDFTFKFYKASLAKIPAEALDVFHKAAASGINLMETLLKGADPADPWSDALKRTRKPGVLEALMAKGYLDAKARFPDRERVRMNFDLAVERLTRLAVQLGKQDDQEGAKFSFTRQKYRLLIEPL